MTQASSLFGKHEHRATPGLHCTAGFGLCVARLGALRETYILSGSQRVTRYISRHDSGTLDFPTLTYITPVAPRPSTSPNRTYLQAFSLSQPLEQLRADSTITRIACQGSTYKLYSKSNPFHWIRYGRSLRYSQRCHPITTTTDETTVVATKAIGIEIGIVLAVIDLPTKWRRLLKLVGGQHEEAS